MRNTILVLILLSSTIAIPFLPSLVPPDMRTTLLLLLSLSAAASAIFLLPRFHSQDPPAPVVVHSQAPPSRSWSGCRNSWPSASKLQIFSWPKETDAVGFGC
jgi:hypothetical protein